MPAGEERSNATFADVVAVDDLGNDRFRADYTAGIQLSHGGRELAGAVRAAGATVTPEHRLVSVGCYFVGNRGSAAAGATFEVARLRDGRSFTRRQIDALEPDGSLWFRALATYHAHEGGPDQQASFPVGAGYDELMEPEPGRPPGPDLARNGLVHPWDADFELRPDQSVDDTTYRIWLRTRLPIGGDPVVQDAAAVCATDLRGGAPGLLITGWPTAEVTGTTLDHTVWLHRTFDAGEWFLLECHAESTFGARSLSFGSMWDQSGKRVASWAAHILARPAATS